MTIVHEQLACINARGSRPRRGSLRGYYWYEEMSHQTNLGDAVREAQFADSNPEETK